MTDTPNTIRDILHSLAEDIADEFGGDIDEHPQLDLEDQSETAINAYILGEVMELINSCYDKDYGIDSVALRNKANKRWNKD